jgi:hypothetical protein
VPGSIKLRGGHTTTDRRLDRLPPETDAHLKKYPFTASRAAEFGIEIPTPVVIGVNWYSAFDRPVKGADGRWRVARDGNLGSLRGGHCVCLPERNYRDNTSWWPYYDQGQEGRCVQFGTSRMMSLINRRQYEIREHVALGRWLYWEAQKIDYWEGGSYPGGSPVYEGTSVDAALNVIRHHGLIRKYGVQPLLGEGIEVFRWAQSMNDVLVALGRAHQNEIPWLNSWGKDYPRAVWVPVDVHARLLDEQGEYGLVTDR